MVDGYVRKSDVIELMRNNMRAFMSQDLNTSDPLIDAFIRGVASHQRDLIKAISDMSIVEFHVSME